MLERIADLPDAVVGINATGEVTADDYKNVLVPAVEAALARGDKVRLLYVLADDVKGLGYTAGAVWQDTKFGLGHYNSWEKVAVVSGKEWLRHSVDIFGYLIPGEVKAFTHEEEDEARSWVTS